MGAGEAKNCGLYLFADENPRCDQQHDAVDLTRTLLR